MNDQAVSVQPASSPPQARRGAAPAAPLWHLGWAVGCLTAAAGLLAGLGSLSTPAAVALGLGAAPGLIGYFWQPSHHRRLVLVFLWTMAATGAAVITGGATGPLALWCFTPLLAGALLAAPAEGTVLSAVAAAMLVLLELSGYAPAPPTGVFRVGLAAAGLLTLGGAAAGALGVLVARARERQAAAEAEQAWMNGVMSELPHLALALDKDGRSEAVFGASLAGLGVETLRHGLMQAVAEADRTAVQASICEAFDHGAGESEFTPIAAPDTRLALSLRRRGEDGLVGLIRPADGPKVPVAQPADGEALWKEQVARTVVETKVQALENKLKIIETARDQALNSLGEARAARAAAETAREGAEANATAKSRFLANMSHELRTPLNAIMGFSDIMRQRMFGDLSAKYAEYAELIHESGRHLTDLINDVLDMSKIEAERYALDLDVFDAREPISGALRLMRLQADEGGVMLRGVLPQQAVQVEADRRALKQIVLNLVSNALKFTPPGGSVTVTAQAVGGALEVVVADTGAGIAREDLERLGKPYEQAGDAEHKAQGTGLGLSLVRAFARLHGGEMTIESELGEGAAVTVRLPVLHAEAELPLQPAAPAPGEPIDAEFVAVETIDTPLGSRPEQPPELIPTGEDSIPTGEPIPPTRGEDTHPVMALPAHVAEPAAEAPEPPAPAFPRHHTAEVIPLPLMRPQDNQPQG